MANTLCKTAVLKLYQDVMEDVIQGVRDFFIEDGVDEQVLQELRQTWEAKLLASKAVENQSDESCSKQGGKKPGDVTNGSNGFPKAQQQQVMKQVVGQVPPNNHVQTPLAQVIDNKMVPIQITLPPQPGSTGEQRILTIQVPATALQGNQLHKILTGPIITATMNLPQPIASSVLQQHVNAALNSVQQAVTIGSVVNKSVIQSDGPVDVDDEDITVEFVPSSPIPGSSCSVNARKSKCRKRKKMGLLAFLCDAPADTSDEEEDGTDEDDASEEADEDKDEDEQEVDEGGPEDEPLNSEDDVTDEEPSDLFDTENVVVCQYDKISRSRNKWKFHLKDGIMNLNGEDYVFQKANGDAEW